MITVLSPEYLQSIIKLNVTHSILSMRIPEVRFSKLTPIIDIKKQLEKRFGTKTNQMSLVLRDHNGVNIAAMDNNNELLGSYGVEEGYIIHCIDEDPNSILKQLEDISLVEKYVMSDEDYDKLPWNVRKFKKQLKEKQPELFSSAKVYQNDNSEIYHEFLEQIVLDQRCELIKEEIRGVLKFVGKVPELGDGYFVGIALDEPQGNCDGSVNGVYYFDSFDKYAVFRRPDEIHLGDYPELEIEEIQIISFPIYLLYQYDFFININQNVNCLKQDTNFNLKSLNPTFQNLLILEMYLILLDYY